MEWLNPCSPRTVPCGANIIGEQDADPSNATDCNEEGPASTRFVRVAEVQAFNGNSSAQG